MMVMQLMIPGWYVRVIHNKHIDYQCIAYITILIFAFSFVEQVSISAQVLWKNYECCKE